MAGLQQDRNPDRKTAHPHQSIVTSTRNRVRGLPYLKMSDSETELSRRSIELQNRVAAYLKGQDISKTPEITDDMLEAISVAIQLSGKYARLIDTPKLRATNTFTGGGPKLTFILSGLQFDYPADIGWQGAFNRLIDHIDPDNTKRFVS